MKKLIFSFLLLSPIVICSCPDDLVSYTVDDTHLPIVKRIVSQGSAQLNIQEPPVYVTDYLTSTGVLRKPACILISENFNNGSYPLKKIALLSAVYNGLQHDDQKNKFHTLLADSRTIEQEAGARAIHCANCPACAYDFSCSYIQTNNRSLSPKELADLVKQLKDAPLCPYHRAIADRFTYRLVHWIYFLGSKICPENRIIAENLNKISRNKKDHKVSSFLYALWITAISTPGIINKTLFEYANRWIGRDVEEKIAKGELAV